MEQEEEDLDMIIPAPIPPPGVGAMQNGIANGAVHNGGLMWNGQGKERFSIYV